MLLFSNNMDFGMGDASNDLDPTKSSCTIDQECIHHFTTTTLWRHHIIIWNDITASLVIQVMGKY